MTEEEYDEFENQNNNNINIHDCKWRVKFYNLNLMGQWDDMGTGNVGISKEVIIYINIIGR